MDIKLSLALFTNRTSPALNLFQWRVATDGENDNRHLHRCKVNAG